MIEYSIISVHYSVQNYEQLHKHNTNDVIIQMMEYHPTKYFTLSISQLLC